MSCINKTQSITAIFFVAFLYWTPRLFAHGGEAINVFLVENRKLVIGPSFNAGPFTQLDGNIFSDLPGIAVLSPGNLVPDKATLGVDVLSGLVFWNGSKIEPTSAELEIRSPVVDGFGHTNNSPISSYVVTPDTGRQSGMQWGTYDGIVPGWDSHGMFSLTPLTAPIGIYGVVLQISSPGFLATDPFLVPFAYDPTGLGQLSVDEYETGIGALNEWAQFVQTPLQAGDANQDLAFDESDLITVFQAGKYRTEEQAAWSEGDWNGAPGGRIGLPPIGDGRFNESDLIAAFQHGLFRTGDYLDHRTPPRSIPEPNRQSLILAAIIGYCSLASRVHTPRSFLQKTELDLETETFS